MKTAHNYCLYYRGEDSSPYPFGDPRDAFWDLERQYFFDGAFSHDEYENRVRSYIADNSDVKNYLTSDAPIENKGFVLFAEDMLEKWDPSNTRIIFEYGR